MKVLVATTALQGARPGDFCWAGDGELVRLATLCTRGQSDPDENHCGCGRAFVGFDSLKSTTTALIARNHHDPQRV